MMTRIGFRPWRDVAGIAGETTTAIDDDDDDGATRLTTSKYDWMIPSLIIMKTC